MRPPLKSHRACFYANKTGWTKCLVLSCNDTNMGVGFAAQLAHILQPKVIIPCHYGYTYPAVRWMGGHPAEFVTTLASSNYKMPFTDIMILSPGGKIVLP